MLRQGRAYNELRKIEIISGYNIHAEGSCLIKFGNTHVICTASVESKVPPFLKGTGSGWVTAEYSMIPRSTGTRMQRESTKGKLGGRTQEIQRLIGRSLRSCVDMKTLGEHQIIIDCDVISADGGTRTAAITGGYVALAAAIKKLVAAKQIKRNPLHSQIAAISCGIIGGVPMIDLNYSEDSNAEVDANFVMNSAGEIIEVQATAEKNIFSKKQFDEMFDLAQLAMQEIYKLQNNALESSDK